MKFYPTNELRTALARFMSLLGYYAGPMTFSRPPLSYWEAVLATLEAHRGELTDSPLSWSRQRREVAVLQMMLRDAKMNPGSLDGLYGPSTEYALERFNGVDMPVKSGSVPPQVRERIAKIANRWPRYSECRKVYGTPGTNQTMLVLPVHMRLAWNPRQRVSRFSCHKMVHDAFLGVIEDSIAAYGEKRWRALGLDLFGGCLNVRRMRGGNKWSTHAWGIAMDIDPAHNRFRWNHKRARLARPEYAEYWKIVRHYGLVSLGKARDFDWMHIQACRL